MVRRTNPPPDYSSFATLLDIPKRGDRIQAGDLPPRRSIASWNCIVIMYLPFIISAVLLVIAKVTDAAPSAANLTGILLAASIVETRTHTLVRKEWRHMTQSNQLEYIKAFKCLLSKPARFQNLWPGSKTRYDDYQALHISSSDFVHHNAIFLPWHRGLLSIFEQDLRNTCNYTGAQPYWDWSKDAVSLDSFAKSPVFDPVYGFGGNGAFIANVTGIAEVVVPGPVPGRTGGGCVTTGPFANLVVPMFKNSTGYNPHCLRRDFSPTVAMTFVNPSMVSWVQQAKDFYQYNIRVIGLNGTYEGITTHGGGHLSVGGEVGDLSQPHSSPGELLFWMHHCMVDQMWDAWQRLDWPARRSDFSGPDKQNAYPFNWFGDIPYTNITLEYPLDYGPFGKIKVSQVMDTKHVPFGGYTYARSGAC